MVEILYHGAAHQSEHGGHGRRAPVPKHLLAVNVDFEKIRRLSRALLQFHLEDVAVLEIETIRLLSDLYDVEEAPIGDGERGLRVEGGA